MKRPPAGRAAFIARGARAKSIGLPITMRHGIDWPHWAKVAWITGWLQAKVTK